MTLRHSSYPLSSYVLEVERIRYCLVACAASGLPRDYCFFRRYGNEASWVSLPSTDLATIVINSVIQFFIFLFLVKVLF